MPLATPRSAQFDADSDEPVDIKPSILLVEDEPTTRLMTARLLKQAGYEVQVVTNGTEALAMFKKRFFPMMLTDWDMPKMTGVALCKAVREMPLEGYVYTIPLTAREGKANVIEGLAAGADDYLTKPRRLRSGERVSPIGCRRQRGLSLLENQTCWRSQRAAEGINDAY